MSKKINLEEIILDIYGCQNVEDFQKSFDISIKMTKDICKQACKQLLELAAENAEITVKLKENCNELSLLDEWTTYIVDKQSILKTINQIE